jgi:hypothetical protein
MDSRGVFLFHVLRLLRHFQQGIESVLRCGQLRQLRHNLAVEEVLHETPRVFSLFGCLFYEVMRKSF